MKPPINRSESVEVASNLESVSPIEDKPEVTKEAGEPREMTLSQPNLDESIVDIGYASASSLSLNIHDYQKENRDNSKKIESRKDDGTNSTQIGCHDGKSPMVTFNKFQDIALENESKNYRHGYEQNIQIPITGGLNKGDVIHSDLRRDYSQSLGDQDSEKKDISHKPLKTGRQILRWNLLFNLLVWMVVSLPVWLPFVSRPVAMFVLPGVQSLFVLMWLVICVLASGNMVRLYWSRNYDFRQDYVESSDLHHLFIVSSYKEPVELLIRTANSIAKQQDVHNITMAFSFEERTPDLKNKIKILTKTFQNSGFARLLFSAHPYGMENEIPGKCSNSNYGFRNAVAVLKKDMGSSFDPERIVVTTCDADSHFPVTYSSALTSRFLSTKNRHSTIYQAPLFYNWGLDGASFITRVTGLVRSTLMMGALIPFNINSMSIFSFSLRLCIDGNYVHPGYQMDDIICLIRWMGVTQQRIKICFIPVPVLSGPTSGATVELDIIEWARQARRWTIGAAEVFHYFVVKSRKMPKLAATSWGLSFLVYYGILLCCGSLYSLSMSLSIYFLFDQSSLPVYISYWLYSLAGAQQLCFLVVFILDVFATRALGVKEYISFVRNVFQWVMSPVVLLLYSLVELYALHEVAVRGKKVCKHGASKKEALK